MSLQTIITNTRTMLGTVSGLVRIYADPPESINEFPSAIVWASRGELHSASDGFARNFHTIMIQVYHNRQVLPEAIDAAKVWPGLVHTAITADPTLGGAVMHVTYPIRYSCQPLRYGDREHYGVSFEMTVKESGA